MITRGMRNTAAILAVGIIAALAPIGARAGHCTGNIVIFSGNNTVVEVPNHPGETPDVLPNEIPATGPVPATPLPDEPNAPRRAGLVWLNSNAAVCLAAPEDELPYDSRIINPGSDAISIRYTVDVGAGTPQLLGELNGMGFDHFPITLVRTAGTTGGFAYDTPRIALPDGAASTGCVTATVFLSEDPDDSESRTFHTVETPGC